MVNSQWRNYKNVFIIIDAFNWLNNDKEHKKASFISEFSSKTHTNNIPMVFLIKKEEIKRKKRNS